MSDNRPVIMKVEHLTKEFELKSRAFGAKPQILHALNDVSLDIYEGETLGVIGESGCGKSTFGRTLIQLYKATKGSVMFEGKNLFSLKGQELKKIKKDIQMVFQDPYSSLDPRKTAGKLIEEPMIVHNLIPDKTKREERVLELMREVGLDIQHVHRFPHEFSGGQRQRINVARALSMNPKVIVCDEPVSALDVSIQAQVINLLKDFQEEKGVSYLFIAHDLSMVRYVSDDVGVMYLGQLVEVCEADEIYKHPLHPYTKGLLGSIPVANPKLARMKEKSGIEGDIPSPISPPTGCRFHTRCPYAKKVCAEEMPELRCVGEGHGVACHLYEGS